jgi:hypothetical protein
VTELERIAKKAGCYIVSEGTLRPVDLIPKYLDALNELAPEACQRAQTPACGFQIVPSYALEDKSHEWWGSELAYEALECLTESLSEHAPEGFEFGANEGDGACFGFWRLEDDRTGDNITLR